MFNTHAFGLKLAQLRKNADMTQSDLAERLNVTRQAVSKYEIGDSFPDVTILVTMAEVFEVSVDELIGAGSPTAGEAAILNSLAQGKEPDTATPEDVASLAVWLKPSAVERLTVNLAKQGINVSRLMDIAVYLSDEGDATASGRNRLRGDHPRDAGASSSLHGLRLHVPHTGQDSGGRDGLASAEASPCGSESH